jgi:hypothetical protein
MVDSKLISQKETSVEIIDFRKPEVRELFSRLLPDQALQQIKSKKTGDSFLGLSRPFKLVTIPNHDDIEYLIKGNQAKNSRWDLWEKLLSESNLNLEIIVLLTENLPEYKVSRNRLFLPEFLTEKRIRIIWSSSLNGIFWSQNYQNYPSALLHWNSDNVFQGNFEALVKPLTVPEIFEYVFTTTKPGEIYNPGLRQAAFGSGYKKEGRDILFEAAKHITGAGNLLSSGSDEFPKVDVSDFYKGKLSPSLPVYKEGIFSEIDKVGKSSIEMCKLFGATNSIVSKDQIPSFSQRLEKTYKEYINSISQFVKSLHKTKDKLESLVSTIDAKDGFDEDEYIKIVENNIDFYSSKPEIPSHERPIRVSSAIFLDILQGLKKGNNIKEYKILLRRVIKEIQPNSKDKTKQQLVNIWSPLTANGGILDPKIDTGKLEKEVKKIFGNRIVKFFFNFPWSILDKKRILIFVLALITMLLSIFWAVSTFIAGSPGDDPVFQSSGFVWWDTFITNFFRNTQWEDVLINIVGTAAALWVGIYLIAKHIINNIERVGRKLSIHLIPEIVRDAKVFLWRTLINDWVLAGDRFEVINYLESIVTILEQVEELLVENYLQLDDEDDSIFQNRHLEPNPILEINLNSVSENGIYKDFEGSVNILKSDLISLLELSFDQEWMKIRGAIGRNFVPERILQNFKKNLTEFEQRTVDNSILDSKIALTTEGQEQREKIIKNLWSEGDYPREKVLDLMELNEESELVHFLNSDEVSLLNGRSEGIIFLRFAPLVLDLPGYAQFVRTKESKVAGVMRLVPMSIQFEYLRFEASNETLESVI